MPQGAIKRHRSFFFSPLSAYYLRHCPTGSTLRRNRNRKRSTGGRQWRHYVGCPANARFQQGAVLSANTKDAGGGRVLSRIQSRSWFRSLRLRKILFTDWLHGPINHLLGACYGTWLSTAPSIISSNKLVEFAADCRKGFADCQRTDPAHLWRAPYALRHCRRALLDTGMVGSIRESQKKIDPLSIYNS